MKLLPICLLFVMCLVAKGSSDSFLCYECENCDILSDSLLKSCPAATTLPPATELPSDPSESTTISPEPSESTTISPVLPSESTTISPVLPSESTTVTPVAPSESTTVTPVAPSESTTISPVLPSESTTISPVLPSESTTISPVLPSESTTISPDPTSESTSSSLATSDSTTISSPSTETGVLLGTGKLNPLGYSLRHSRSLRSVLREGSNPNCFSINVKEGNVVTTKKGCIEVAENNDACQALKDKYGESIENCKVCKGDRCNSSAALKFSFVIFVITILISTFVNK